MTQIIWFDDEQAVEPDVVGGKGANLGRLTGGGFVVPAGFTVPTSAYVDFLRAADLEVDLASAIGRLDYTDPDELERVTAEIRRRIVTAPMPSETERAITAAYQMLGAGSYVAVRSSGAAEDLEGASFAGLHDTYLDVRGCARVLSAVKQCWASVWSARATSYRQTKDFGHLESPIAVVIQTMVTSEVSGVMFTGNPFNAATDEIVINASWGLGEAIVQGIATPDQIIVRHGALDEIERTLGAKEKRVVRDPDTGVGTVIEDNSFADATRFCLDERQAADLAVIGRLVQDSYGGFPQDIEWALTDGVFHVLQSRPVTATAFSWDAEVNESVPGTAPADQLWSRAWADEVWTGAITPLMFSWRTQINNDCMSLPLKTFGFPELHHSQVRAWQFHKGQVYYNPNLHREIIEKTMPPVLRPAAVAQLPIDWQPKAIDSPFDWLKYARMYLRLELLEPQMGFRFCTRFDKILAGDLSAFDGLSSEALVRLSDRELEKHTRAMIKLEGDFYHNYLTGLMFIFRDVLAIVGYALVHWYDGDNQMAFADMMSGTRVPTATTIENHDLWRLSEQIRNSRDLSTSFAANPGVEFFRRCADTEDGLEFLAEYQQFVGTHGHRGHSDRDIYFTRRAEDPCVDYSALKAMLSVADSADPAVREAEVRARSLAVLDDVTANIAGKPFGGIKASLVRALVEYAHRIVAVRDNERYVIDRSTFAVKRGFLELGHRLQKRGLLHTDRDVFFLTGDELHALRDGRANSVLAQAKVAARMRDFDGVDTKELIPPLYLRRGLPVDVDAPAIQPGDGTLVGMGTSRGTVTGIARVIKSLRDIGRIESGDILVTNSTDPGWTPIFLVISGIVLETGGLLAHGAMLSREYGLPGVQIAQAMQYVPDGATITINGDAGTVTVLAAPPNSAEQETLESVPV